MGILFLNKVANQPDAPMLESETAVLPILERSALSESKLLTPAETLRPEFAELLDAYEVPLSGAESPAEILGLMRQTWLGNQPGRVSSFLMRHLDTPNDARLELLDSIGYIHDVTAGPDVYEAALVMGGTLDWVRSRLENLKQEWLAGAELKEIVMLGADRPLDLRETESVARLHATSSAYTQLSVRSDWKMSQHIPYRDEMDMMRHVFDQADLPAEWGSDIPVRWIKSLKGDSLRVNTEDTVIDYLKEVGLAAKGKILTASSQPFAHYQNLVTATAFAERGGVAEDFVVTGMADTGPAGPRVYQEQSYIRQLLLRFQYEVRLFSATQANELTQDSSGAGISTRQHARSA
jgi:hypothetical protein